MKLNELRPAWIGLRAVSLGELYEGVYRARNQRAAEHHLLTFLSGVTILPVIDEIGKIFGCERARLRQLNQLMGDFDLIIAATCLHYQVPL